MGQDKRLRLGVLLSGGGRTLQNLCDQIAADHLPATVEVVLSSRAKAYGVQRARMRNIPVRVVGSPGEPPSQVDEAITATLSEFEVDLVCMAGFLRLWTIPQRYEGCVMNIHPALLPDFGGEGYYGRRVHEAVLAAGCSESGCTVHFCDNEYDHGPIILQRRVPVLPNDTPETLADRVFEQERIAYPEAIRLFAAGCLHIDGRRVTLQ